MEGFSFWKQMQMVIGLLKYQKEIQFTDENDPDFPVGSIQTEGTNPTNFNVVFGGDNTQIDGFHNPTLDVSTISGHLYYDVNGNGTQDVGEPNYQM